MDWGNCVVDGVATLTCVPIVFRNVINAALIFSGVTAVFFIIFAGYKFISSGGDPKQADSAKQTMTYAIAGLVLILLSFFIVNFIAYFTGVDCIKTIGFDNCK